MRSHTRKPRVFVTKNRYQAQQATEKAIKAVLVDRKIPYPYTHDINALLSVLEQNGISFPENLWSAVILTTYASDTR